MSGIDRLRAIAGAWDELGLGGTLAEIADQIERERAEDCYRIGLDHGAVLRVAADMERHCLGHEGMEDSPVARWARELREALKSDTSDAADTQNPSCADPDSAADVTSEAPKVTRDPAEDVSMSAYDLLPADEREAIAWVRDHGGLEFVKERLDWVVSHCSTKQQLDFDFWLSGHVMYELGFEEDIADRDEVERRLLDRLMPEGMEWLVEAWPRYESGELVGFGDEVNRLGEVFAICLYCDGSYALNFRAYSKDECVKRAVVDSWERLEEDAAKNYVDYWGCGGFLCSECPAVVDGKRPWERFGCGDYPEASKNCTVAKARDIVRRAKALTEKEDGNE